MLSEVVWHLPAASAGLGSLALGPASGLALAGLLAAAVFVALLGACAPADEARPSGLEQAGISRPAAMLCAAALGLIAGLAGGVALMIWAGQGPAPALGLLALALACVAGALAFGGLALRRR
ncbi:hypothetical protein DFH01_03925 [Falsiroseomonas bella]|uniref:Uncharacterized protein n=1 Tax=Falsiroseomonas bella TaxID=2184016 RepID=A0A317FH98_9PROT|nr:hypothetical protein [Falsiroseomonas bella]PWS38440.1 hypothetical protein DFH01_03925 [Falsiroseomonas bella]